MNQGDVATLLPYEAAVRAHRMFGRFMWSEESPNRTNPGAHEAGLGRLYWFVVKLSFISRRFEG